MVENIDKKFPCPGYSNFGIEFDSSLIQFADGNEGSENGKCSRAAIFANMALHKKYPSPMS